MENNELRKRTEIIFEAVQGMKHHEWSRIAQGIEKKYNSLSAKVEMTDSEQMKNLVLMDLGIK